MSASTHTGSNTLLLRWSVIIAIALVAFFASYRFAVASSAAKVVVGSSSNGSVAPAAGGGCCGSGSTAAAATGGSTSAPAGGGGCCGGGAKGPATTKAATVNGAVQTVSVDVSKGYYDPDTIQLKAGVPAEITFSQASGCTGIVQSSQLGFSEDLSSGPKTVKIAALQPGTYQFACGMNMVTGTIVVK